MFRIATNRTNSRIFVQDQFFAKLALEVCLGQVPDYELCAGSFLRAEMAGECIGTAAAAGGKILNRAKGKIDLICDRGMQIS